MNMSEDIWNHLVYLTGNVNEIMKNSLGGLAHE